VLPGDGIASGWAELEAAPPPLGGGPGELPDGEAARTPLEWLDGTALCSNAHSLAPGALEGRRSMRNGIDRVRRLVRRRPKREPDVRRPPLDDPSAGAMGVYYQPIISVVDAQLAGLEALVRWHDPLRGVTEASGFLYAAQASGLEKRLGAWVLEETCTTASTWGALGLEPPPVTVNFMQSEAIDRAFPVRIADALAAADLDPTLLELDLPEGLFATGPRIPWFELRAVQDIGVAISVDLAYNDADLLEYLGSIGVGGVKIDLAVAASSPARRAEVERVVARAHELGMTVTGKRVQAFEEIELLRELLCDRMQGYAFGEPLPRAQTEALLANRLIGLEGAQPGPRPSDRRRERRSPIMIRARYARLLDGGADSERFEAMLFDIGELGMQMRLSAAVEVDDEIEVAMRLPEVDDPLTLRATIVEGEQAGDTVRVNARFTNVASPDHSRLAVWLAARDAKRAERRAS
jgi:EAL domain-containing protein (putative c-di-GMP-specific phosphodiesterase class I)